MPDDDPKVFRHWVQWMYVGRISFKISRVEDINNVLVKAWILGDKLGCPIFQDIVMLELLACHSPHAGNGLIEPSTLRTAYEGSAPGSMLRKWAIDFFLFETRNKVCGKVSAEQRNKLWFSEAKDIDDFSQDYMEAGMKCSLEGEPANPYTRPSQYMVVH